MLIVSARQFEPPTLVQGLGPHDDKAVADCQSHEGVLEEPVELVLAIQNRVQGNCRHDAGRHLPKRVMLVHGLLLRLARNMPMFPTTITTIIRSKATCRAG